MKHKHQFTLASHVYTDFQPTYLVQNTNPHPLITAISNTHASGQTSGFSLTLRNRGKGGWARDLGGSCLPRYSAGVKSRSVVLG